MREQIKLLEHPLSRKKKDRLIISLIIICYVIICICAWFWLWNWAGWGSPPPPDEYYNISLVQLNQTENNPDAFKAKRVGLIVTGGNVDLDKLPWMASS